MRRQLKNKRKISFINELIFFLGHDEVKYFQSFVRLVSVSENTRSYDVHSLNISYLRFQSCILYQNILDLLSTDWDVSSISAYFCSWDILFNLSQITRVNNQSIWLFPLTLMYYIHPFTRPSTFRRAFAFISGVSTEPYLPLKTIWLLLFMGLIIEDGYTLYHLRFKVVT